MLLHDWLQRHVRCLLEAWRHERRSSGQANTIRAKEEARRHERHSTGQPRDTLVGPTSEVPPPVPKRQLLAQRATTLSSTLRIASRRWLRYHRGRTMRAASYCARGLEFSTGSTRPTRARSTPCRRLRGASACTAAPLAACQTNSRDQQSMWVTGKCKRTFRCVGGTLQCVSLRWPMPDGRSFCNCVCPAPFQSGDVTQTQVVRRQCCGTYSLMIVQLMLEATILGGK
jgi:hypothetical protein